VFGSDGTGVYSPDTVSLVVALIEGGHTYSEIERRTGVSRSTVRSWASGRTPLNGIGAACNVCRRATDEIPAGPYAYLLGLYLGDGCLSGHPRGVYKLRITCCDAYPDLMAECALTMAEVLPNRVNRVQRTGCTELGSYSKHWPCLFPQHGRGPKHKRSIALVDWQRSIVDRFPAPLLRGLVHSDGCRVLNKVNGRAYPRYHFTNVSADIRGLFSRACELIEVEWRQSNARTLSVARRDSVGRLDDFIGPKR